MNQSEFLKSVFQFCDGHLELRAIPSRAQTFIHLDDPDLAEKVDRFCESNKKNHIYYGAGTRDGKGGRKENIVDIPVLWTDIDFKDTPKEIAADKLKKFPFKPSFTVKSGGGAHLYWLLKEPGQKDDIPKFEDANRRIAYNLGGDSNACDAARVLRLPDTQNYKYEPSVKCEIVRFNDFQYSLGDFLEILPEPPTKKPATEGQSSNNEAGWLEEAMKGVSEGERNATAAKIAGYWINNLSPSDVLTILKTWNLNNTPSLSERDLETIIKSVSRYEPEKAGAVDLQNVYDSKRMVDEYRRYIKSLKNNRFITGIHEIDRRIRGVAGGEVLTLIARAGSFKTATLQNLLKN